MKKQDLMRYYLPISYVIWGLEWIYLLSAVFAFFSIGFTLESVVVSITMIALMVMFGKLGDDFEKLCTTIHIPDIPGLSRRQRRKIKRDILRNGDL